MSSQAAVKLHRRVVRLDDASWTVLSLRPGDPVQLDRLLWALAFQRHERTLVLLEPPFLGPIPFDAGPSSPILLVNSNLGTPQRLALAELRAQLPLSGPSLGTVRLRTVGLDRALEEPAAVERRSGPHDTDGWRRWTDRVHGIVVYAAPDAALRQQAVMIAEPRVPSGDEAGSP